MATKALNPDKEHRTMRKAEEKLQGRIKHFESLPQTQGYTKPGSKKMRK